jgi:hypothetical protein
MRRNDCPRWAGICIEDIVLNLKKDGHRAWRGNGFAELAARCLQLRPLVL